MFFWCRASIALRNTSDFGRRSSPPSVVTSSRRDDLRSAGQLEIHFRTDRLCQEHHIAVLDVTAIFPQVHSYGISPAEFGQDGSGDRVGFYRPTGLPDRCHVIDVNAEFYHGRVSLEIDSWSLDGERLISSFTQPGRELARGAMKATRSEGVYTHPERVLSAVKDGPYLMGRSVGLVGLPSKTGTTCDATKITVSRYHPSKCIWRAKHFGKPKKLEKGLKRGD